MVLDGPITEAVRTVAMAIEFAGICILLASFVIGISCICARWRKR